MPTAPQCRPIVQPRLTTGLWSPIPSIRSAIASLCCAARLLFDRCATAPETRPLPAVSRAHPARDVDDCPATSNGGSGGSPVALPPYPPSAVLGAPPPAVSIIRRRRCGPVIGREQRRVRPVIPPSCPRLRSNSDHAGESMYSGEIESLDRDPGIATLVPLMQFPGN